MDPDPTEMTPKQRLAEIASILASALREYPESSAPASNSPDKRLDVSRGPTALCANGLTDRDPREARA